MIGNDELVAPQAFTYLGSIITNDGKCDRDMEHRIGKANQSFGRLRSRVWSSHDIRLEAKLALYNAIVLSLLLYGCDARTLYARQFKIPTVNNGHQVERLHHERPSPATSVEGHAKEILGYKRTCVWATDR